MTDDARVWQLVDGQGLLAELVVPYLIDGRTRHEHPHQFCGQGASRQT